VIIGVWNQSLENEEPKQGNELEEQKFDSFINLGKLYFKS
jgi:hypothetical protein